MPALTSGIVVPPHYRTIQTLFFVHEATLTASTALSLEVFLVPAARLRIVRQIDIGVQSRHHTERVTTLAGKY